MDLDADVAIVGGGLAGSLTAAMLSRKGISCVVTDPHDIYPDDFRCEKIGGYHVAALARTGLADDLLPLLTSEARTNDGNTWLSRYGRLIERRPGDQYSFDYRRLVNATRELSRPFARWETAKAVSVSIGPDRQGVVLSNGKTVSARLVVLSNGLNIGLGHSLGIRRQQLSTCHSITIGFDLAASGGGRFPFGSLTHHSEKVSDRVAYITIFPIEERARANVFVYRQADDPIIRQLRQEPAAALRTLFPKLERIIGPYSVIGQVRARPIDLYRSEGYLQQGVVLVGDAFATSCPAAGTGTYRVFTDVGRLCHYVPTWLATDGMSVEKIAQFYNDPIKTRCDDWSLAQAFNLKSMSIDPGIGWTASRLSRFGFQFLRGKWRQARSIRASRLQYRKQFGPSLSR